MLAASTIYGHLANAIEAGETIDLNELAGAEAQEQIAAALPNRLGNIGGARESLGNKYRLRPVPHLSRGQKRLIRPPLNLRPRR